MLRAFRGRPTDEPDELRSVSSRRRHATSIVPLFEPPGLAARQRKYAAMLHYTCDSCGRDLGRERFIVRVEVTPAFDPDEIDEVDLDADNLEKIADEIAAMESTGDFEYADCGARSLQYDLCPACRDRFVSDPLGQESLRRLSFSQN